MLPDPATALERVTARIAVLEVQVHEQAQAATATADLLQEAHLAATVTPTPATAARLAEVQAAHGQAVERECSTRAELVALITLERDLVVKAEQAARDRQRTAAAKVIEALTPKREATRARLVEVLAEVMLLRQAETGSATSTDYTAVLGRFIGDRRLVQDRIASLRSEIVNGR